jgi:hypothetical protein
VLVIDDSYSMEYRGDNQKNFARAKQLAASLVRESRPGDVFTVISMSRPPKTIAGPAAIEQAAAANQIESLTESHTAADVANTMPLIMQALLNDKIARKMPLVKEVYFFTDMQRTTWSAIAAHSPRANENGDEALQLLPKEASIVAIDVGQPQAANLAVTGLSTRDAFASPGRDIAFDATLHQFANGPRSRCTVEFLVDSVTVAEQVVDVPAGGDVTVRFNHRFHAAGSHAICVRAPGDRLEVDNSRWLVVPVRDEVRVLCVAGRDGAARYVADALNPNPAGESPIRPVVISEGDFADVALAEFDCVFMCNVARLTASEAKRLARFAAAGGGVVFYLGDRVDPSSYNAYSSDSNSATRGSTEPPGVKRQSDSKNGENSKRQPLLPVRIGELITKPQFGLDPLEYRHPIAAPFRGRERAGLLTTPVARHYHLEVPQDRGDVDVAVAMPTGNPFIVTAPVDRGRVIVVATDGSLSSVDPQSGEPWTVWPTWPSFLPIVRELLSFATAGERNQWQQLVGTPIASWQRGVSRDLAPDARLASNSEALQIIRPDGRPAPVSLQTTPTGLEWHYDETNVGGIYTLRGLPQGEVQFAVNLDTAESDLTKIDPKDPPPQFVVRSTWQDSQQSQAGDVLARAPWNQSLLWGVLALLFAESFMAWQFGRGAV